PPSLTHSQQTTPISPQMSVSSRNSSSRSTNTQSIRSSDILSQIPSPISSNGSRGRSRSYTSSTGPQLVPIWVANSGLVINGTIRGIKLQIIFSIIHHLDWMTQYTARRCGVETERLRGRYYLEKTYMDHSYEQRSRRQVVITLGQVNGQDVTITTANEVPVVHNDNFHYQSQSLQDEQSRLFILIGFDTIQR